MARLSLVQNYKFHIQFIHIQFKLVSTALRVHTLSFWTKHIIGNRLTDYEKEVKCWTLRRGRVHNNILISTIVSNWFC